MAELANSSGVRHSIEEYTQGRMTHNGMAPERQQGSGVGYTGAIASQAQTMDARAHEGDTGVYDDTFRPQKQMSMPNYENIPKGPFLRSNIGEFHPNTTVKI